MDIHLLLNDIPGTVAEPHTLTGGKTSEASYKTRCTIHALRFKAGWTYQAIAEDEDVKMTPSGVWKICQGPTTPRKKKTGRHPILTIPTRKLLVQTATISAENRRKTYKEIAWMCGVTACDKTLRAAFAKEGFNRRSAQEKPFLDDIKKAKRLYFALSVQNWTKEHWRRVIWTDECYIWITGVGGRVYVTRAAGEEYLDDCLKPKYKKKDSIMVWGAVLGNGGKKQLIAWEKDNWGNISAATYVNYILVPALVPMWYWERARLGEEVYVAEDGAPAHRAAYTQSFRQYYGMPSFVWPPSSPDLNPIENIWGLLKKRLNERVPKPSGKAEMRAAIEEEWNQISEKDILKYVDSMPERIQAVIAAQGGHTRW